MERDFRKSTVYQIYPKSFYDTTGDGRGDLNGVTQKLDYLQKLGVDYLWLTPFFPSPQRDNGYDVADYLSIDPAYGTMQDLETLLAEAKARGMGLMLDMVFNHTSTAHEWFRRALAGDTTYQDYYFFRDGAPDTPPNNWVSKFGGSAWAYCKELGKWYLHLFDETQADLNWDNPAVRQELKRILRFWKAKGVAGFRFDVVNLVSKASLESDYDGDGRRFYTDGPHIHDYLRELVADSGIGDLMTVGEMSSTTMSDCRRYAGADTGELKMVFNFHHLKVDYKNGQKWTPQPFDFAALKSLLFAWQQDMAAHNAWNAVFWCNHDQPRIVSRFGDEGVYRARSAKMLATAIHCLRGTPYVYQGEELGMTNPHFSDITQYVDVESLNYYEILLAEGKTQQEALDILAQRSRDNSRTPMQWTAGANAGFTSGTPWLAVNGNCRDINAEAALADPDSVLYHYQRLIALRKELDVVADGRIVPLLERDARVFGYRRENAREQLLVLCNFYGEDARFVLEDAEGWQPVLGNCGDLPKTQRNICLRRYEAVVYRRDVAGM